MNRAARAGRGAIGVIARIGYLAKGSIFLTVGGLALMAVLGFSGGVVTGTDGAIHTLGRTAPGRVLFGLLAVGLAAHVFWRLWQALVDPAEKGRGTAALIQRTGYLISAGLYATVLLSVLSAVTGVFGGGRSADEAAEFVTSLPGGYALLSLVGTGVMLAGVYQLYRAWAQPFRHRWRDTGVPERCHRLLGALSSFGIAVRALLFLMLGWHGVRAGWMGPSDHVFDLAAALWRISAEQFGAVLLGVTASGLMAYGVYCWINAAMRRIETFPEGAG